MKKILFVFALLFMLAAGSVIASTESLVESGPPGVKALPASLHVEQNSCTVIVQSALAPDEIIIYSLQKDDVSTIYEIGREIDGFTEVKCISAGGIAYTCIKSENTTNQNFIYHKSPEKHKRSVQDELYVLNCSLKFPTPTNC